jgi:NTP pyrophosphatase (non-canonical NTP hydrolase)
MTQKWMVTQDPKSLRRLGKLSEELGELLAVIGRTVIQGIDGVDPATKQVNRLRLQNEMADVLAQLQLTAEHFDLDAKAASERVAAKLVLMAEWEAFFGESPVQTADPHGHWNKPLAGQPQETA